MLLRIEIAKHERMAESGSSLLRLIQNQDTPLLDLFVRESIQNSLDAAKNTSLPVTVELNVGSFEASQLNANLEGVEDELNKRYHLNGKAYKFLEIRDSNTTGLTGPTNYENVKKNENGVYDFGNLLKLVYEICKPQLNEGSGGSWGLGKTIYFRMGIGLVLYYTRIKEKGKSVSRLAACFVENENSIDAILPKSEGINRGIAWWGKISSTGASVPIEDEAEIERILKIFGIEPYSNNTGTTIIIPYIDENKLLSEVYANNEDVDQINRPYWTTSISDYLRVAIQRWYAPRINNSKYTYGAFFKAIVDDKKIQTQDMLPLFKIVRELYIKANGSNPSDSFLNDMGVEIETEPILLRGSLVTNTTVGTLAYVKVSKDQMLMLPPNNKPSPYHQIDNYFDLSEEANAPIIMYTRKPGMIVGYDYNSTWTHGMSKTDPNEFVIGLFVANSKNIVNCDEKMTLEEYIRKGEKADHTSWQDHTIPGLNKRIIALTQHQVVKKINQRFTSQSIDRSVKKHVGLGHKLADLLLPSYSFGRQPTHQNSNGNKLDEPANPAKSNTNNQGGIKQGSGSMNKPVPPVISNKKTTSLKIGKPKFTRQGIQVPFALFVKDTSSVTVNLMVNTDFKMYGYELWESEEGIGKAFPLHFVSFSIYEMINDKIVTDLSKYDVQIDEKTSICQTSDVRIEFEKGNISKKACNVIVTAKKDQLQFNGIMTFMSSDSSVKWLINVVK